MPALRGIAGTAAQTQRGGDGVQEMQEGVSAAGAERADTAVAAAGGAGQSTLREGAELREQVLERGAVCDDECGCGGGHALTPRRSTVVGPLPEGEGNTR